MRIIAVGSNDLEQRLQRWRTVSMQAIGTAGAIGRRHRGDGRERLEQLRQRERSPASTWARSWPTSFKDNLEMPTRRSQWGRRRQSVELTAACARNAGSYPQ
ncbi:hypothetical protein [Dactylosporangium matsuzakiense]|uniref:Uncharacterized protein n=1 Tax=Dactylosporangium matsuzakiense TaxID=53360 RepID=A0A9W6NQC3_9ACTN|nr:hypothetical protein [Dactylosporangium matsuzakiense]GLL05111.1 hypothetical protein GCM10017581_068580 [Dactylosporangium matsuzakiense]